MLRRRFVAVLLSNPSHEEHFRKLVQVKTVFDALVEKSFTINATPSEKKQRTLNWFSVDLYLASAFVGSGVRQRIHNYPTTPNRLQMRNPNIKNLVHLIFQRNIHFLFLVNDL